jgi:hypothetical protein
MKVNAANDVDAGGGSFLDGHKHAGFYHLVIEKADEGAGSGDPDAKFECQVLASTVEGTEGKRYDHAFFLPDMSRDDDSIERAKKVNTAFLVAIGLMVPEDFGKDVDIDVPSAAGRQFCIQLEQKMEQNPETGSYDKGTRFLRPSFANIYHVDDPDAKQIPKNLEALKMLPPEQRHGAEWFDWKKKTAAKTSSEDTTGKVSGAGQFDDLV